MPTLSEGQIRGDAGERWFPSQLPRGWIPQKPSTDVGIDLLVVICEPGILNGLEFRVQIKTSKNFVRRGGNVVIRDLNMESVRYWFANPTPVLLVAYEESSGIAYFGWHDDVVPEPRKKLRSRQSTLSVHLKPANTVSVEGWKSIRKRLEEHYSAILRAFYQSEVSGFLVPTLHDLATHIKYLVYTHCARLWDDNKTEEEKEKAQKLLMLLDFRTHQDVIKTLDTLVDKLSDFPVMRDRIDRITDFIERYKDDVSTFIRGFKELPVEMAPEDEISVDPVRMRVVRPVIIDALLDTMRLLSQPAKSGDSKGGD